MTATTIRVQMAQRKDTAANWTAANPILLSGEIGYETDTKKFKIGNGSTAWNSLAYLPIPDGSGNLTITGNLEIGSTGSLTFEGSTADGFETTLAVTNPTADRTITLPDVTGTVVTTGDTGSVTSTMIANGTIVDADISSTAEIAVSKLANGTANQVIVTDGTNVSWSDNLTLAGDLTVNGTTTTINTQDLLVEDKNIIIGNVATPSDVTADGGGITLKGATDKTINWVDATDAWTLSEHVNVASGKEYRIAGTKVLDATSLGSSVLITSANITDGTIVDGDISATAEIAVSKLADGTARQLLQTDSAGTGVEWASNIDIPGTLDVTGAATFDSSVAVTGTLTKSGNNVVTVGDTGTVTSTMILDGTIVDGDVNATAAIAGTKISPNFGSQNAITTGTSTAASFIPTSSTAPTNGLYLPAANSVALSTGGSGRLFVDASGNVGVGSTPSVRLDVRQNQAAYSYFDFYNTTAGGGIVWRQIVRNLADTGTTSIDLVKYTSGGFAVANNDTGAANFTAFNVGASERLRITSTGNVGIGTSAPGSVLDIKLSDSSTTIGGSTSVIRVNNGSGTLNATSGIEFFHGIDTSSNTARLAGIYGLYKNFNGSGLGGDLVFATNTPGDSTIDERLRITSAGFVGIGTSVPNYLITANSSSAISALQFINSSTGSTASDGFLVYNNGLNAILSNEEAGDLRLQTSGQQRLTIDSSGRVGIGTASPSQLLTLQQTSAGAAVDCLFLNNSSVSANTSVGISFGPNVSNTVDRSAVIRGINESGGTGNATGLQFLTNANGASPTEKARLTASGQLLVGTSSVVGDAFGGAGGVRSLITAGTSASIGTHRNGADAFGNAFIFTKARGAATQAVIQDDTLGIISFQGANGSGFNFASEIRGEVDGAVTGGGANDMPGRLIFSTTSDGVASPTERLRITSAGVLQVADAGNIAVGTTTGTKIGTATTQKLGFFNKTPVVQPAAVADATDAASVITQLNALLARMRDLGLIAT